MCHTQQQHRRRRRRRRHRRRHSTIVQQAHSFRLQAYTQNSVQAECARTGSMLDVQDRALCTRRLERHHVGKRWGARARVHMSACRLYRYIPMVEQLLLLRKRMRSKPNFHAFMFTTVVHTQIQWQNANTAMASAELNT